MQSPVTIAMVLATPGTGWGGMEQQVLDLSGTLAQQGQQVHVLAHPEYADRFPKGVHFHSMPMTLGRRNPWLRHRLHKALASIGPDVCHAHGSKAVSLIGSARPTSYTRVATVHGIKSSAAGYGQLDGVITVSEALYNAVSHPNKVLIPNGVATTAYPANLPRPLTEANNRPLYLAIGRLEPVKGFDRLLQAWSRLSLPGYLAIAGAGSQRPALERLIDQLGLTHRAGLIGYQPDIRPWLAHADACVMSSEREGFGYVVVEALQAGCPVLATPVGCATELLPTHCLARDCSTESLATLLATQLTDLDGLKLSQASAMDRARRDFSIAAMAERTLAFYRSLISDQASHHD